MMNLNSHDGHLDGNTRITRENDAQGEEKKHPQMAHRSNSSTSQGQDEVSVNPFSLIPE